MVFLLLPFQFKKKLIEESLDEEKEHDTLCYRHISMAAVYADTSRHAKEAGFVKNLCRKSIGDTITKDII